ncbi:hypothetical protein ACHAW5_003699 [Stephanodiscus triporus]|uniref:TRIP4/RQT4 C2HC5-type zinc finger domain-containing protein n=1 Tax=Stephanodiscus triporus TaxID=2934178 RepID=A0ABD3QKP8_9STRA
MGDSPDDISEYLSNFVTGDESEEGDDRLRRFSIDVAKFRPGDVLFAAPGDRIDGSRTGAAAMAIEGKSKPRVLDEAAAQREVIKRREMEARERQRKERDLLKIRKEEEAAAAAVAAKSKQSESRSEKKTGDMQDPDVNLRSFVVESDAKRIPPEVIEDQTTLGAETQKAEKQKFRPERGTPKGVSCGCYGNEHRALTNCLNCGRIACELEGVNDYCHFCGYFIEGLSPYVDTGDVDSKLASAMRHKERLLEFDRTSATRTRIHDDQEDYFSAATSMWSTEQEREHYRAMEETRQRNVHERKKHVLQIKF